MTIIEKRHVIEIGDPAQITIALVGCGGTGSFAALHLARLAWSMKQAGRVTPRLVFVDPDTVELKNVGRQNFCPAEVGQPKAVTLATRFGHAFGLEIRPIVGPVSAGLIDGVRPRIGYQESGLLLVVGCVDSPEARRDIQQAWVEHLEIWTWKRLSAWWLDAGNGEQGGQVLIGNCLAGEPVISALGVCEALPLPGLVEPGLIVNDELGMVNDELACAEAMLAETQSLMVNQALADWLAVYAYRLLVAGDLDLRATRIDQVAGRVSSEGITGGTVLALEGGEDEGALPARVDNDDIEWPLDLDQLREIYRETGDNPLEEPICVECGGDLAGGREEIDGIEEDILFCPVCGWWMAQHEWQAMFDQIAEEVEREPA